METVPKHAPHAFAHARPWDKFKGKSVGRKEVNIRTVFRPGHKANPVLDTENVNLPTSATYGAYTGVPRSSGVALSRRNFGSHANTEDSLGPVNLEVEQATAHYRQGSSVVARQNAERVKKLEEAPPDTLRWDPNGGQQRSALVQQRRRAAALAEQEVAEAEARRLARLAPAGGPVGERAADDEAAAATAAAAARAKREVRDTLRDQPRMLNANARRHEEQRQVRQMLQEERQREQVFEAQQARQAAALDQALARGESDLASLAGKLRGGQPGTLGGASLGANASARQLLSNPDRVAALSDPRVQAALDKALNEPNGLAMQQYKHRNTTRVSAERKF